ncbi:MAG: outer membrane beta-barrel protein [Flavobacteriales bacterium]|nr:outer membrane beta-barrel protein [Flavobacteriales bacterium]
MALLVAATAMAQRGVTTFGLQVKPVFALPYFQTLTTMERPHLTGQVELDGGMAFGMSVRIGLTDIISLETGIGQIQRRYTFGLANDTSGYREQGHVRYVGYEIPLMALAYMRTGERTYMNAALGFSADMYPSDVQQELEEGFIYMYRNRWVQAGVVANLGWEYRTAKSGIFHIGATFHRPFGDMAIADLTYWDVQRGFFPYRMRGALSGSYLTVDLRYYFHEDPSRVRQRRR